MDKDTFDVLLVDDHTLYRDGLRSLFDHWEEYTIIGEAENGQEALEFCHSHTPDLVLMDIQMPVMNGVEASRLIHAKYPAIAIVILTMSVEEGALFEAIRQGARGYVLKDTPARQLRHRLRGVMQGEAVLSGPATSKVFDELKRKQPIDDRSASMHSVAGRLSESEIEVLKLVAQGLSNEEIASGLFLSEGTVKKKLAAILRKLALENRVQAAVYAVRAGIVD